MVYVLVCFDKTLIKINLESGRFIWPITVHHWGKSGGADNSRQKSGGKNWCHGGHCFVAWSPGYKKACSACFLIAPKITYPGVIYHELRFHTSITIWENSTQICGRQIWWRQFLSRAFLFSVDSSLCQVECKKQSTVYTKSLGCTEYATTIGTFLGSWYIHRIPPRRVQWEEEDGRGVQLTYLTAA